MPPRHWSRRSFRDAWTTVTTNSLLYGINYGLLRRLQSVQNAAARLVTGAGRRDHITPVLRRLHWLPVHQRVVFKVAGLVHQSLSHWMESRLRTSSTTAVHCLTLADVHSGRFLATSER